MRETRALTLTERQAVYKNDRIDDQRRWYASKARASSVNSQRWGIAVLLLECLGAAMAVASLGNMEGFGKFGPGTLLGVIAALIAAATAWTQAKQFGNLAAAYTIAHQELTSIRGLLARPLEGTGMERVRRLRRGRDLPRAHHVACRPHRRWQLTSSRGVARLTGSCG